MERRLEFTAEIKPDFLKTFILAHQKSEVSDFLAWDVTDSAHLEASNFCNSCSSIAHQIFLRLQTMTKILRFSPAWSEVMLSFLYPTAMRKYCVACPDMSLQKSWIKSHGKVPNLKSTRKFPKNIGFTMIYMVFPLFFPCFVAPKKTGFANSTLQDSSLAVLGTSAACWCAVRAGRCFTSWWLLVVETCFSIGRFWETMDQVAEISVKSMRKSTSELWGCHEQKATQIQRSTMLWLLWILVGLHPTWPMALLVAWLWLIFFEGWMLN